ncbi:MAG: hypothetical protein A2X94_17565 [Bdellovibrionales bacterium GWB1_55_8]|nr:MAG: hypothetical protein A2X94_17565 [Bdellovibrionales bacterium GWB1_55_8]
MNTSRDDYEIRELSRDEFAPLFKANREKMFADTLTFRAHDAMSEAETDAIGRLRKNLGQLYEFNLGLFYKNEFIGWSFGRQLDHERFYMVNSAIFPEHRGKGLYQEMLRILTSRVSKEGFQIIYSRHAATNSAVLVPKLKAGFIISGFEISDLFGLLVHLSYFSNPLRRRMMDVRAGQAIPDQELRKYLPG